MPVETLSLVTLILVAVAAVAAVAAALSARRAAHLNEEDRVSAALSREMAQLRSEFDQKSATQRLELTSALSKMGDSLDQRVGALTANFDTRLTGFAELQQKVGADLADGQHKRLGETNQAVNKLIETLTQQQVEGRKALGEDMDKLRLTLTGNLEQLRKENEAKLEQMRLTVDEKLQGTLEKRLGESFKQVSDRLEAVHKGLGEMQTLASGVGDLKRVLTNVKTRGGWGEMQLGALLEEMLAPEQFVTNAAIEPGSAQRVEFAVRMPGQGEGDSILLPIDAKFPHEDYERLLAAHELGEAVAIDAAARALEKAVRLQAKTISDSYVRPPHSTDFAIMYLPTEGLYAEVARRPGLMRELQKSFRVMVAGPSNLAAFLNSLQMGFRTLAIQKRSSEVWQVLGAAKAEFQRYGDVWDKLGKQLDTARRTVDEAGKRTRAVERKLRGVEVIDGPVTPTALLAADIEEDETDAPAE